MMCNLLRTPASAVALLCLLIQCSSAVVLQDFTPRQNDLTGQCATIYTTNIDGCSGSDFSSQKCSSTCVSALKSIAISVRKSCTGQGDSGSIIEAMLNGEGVSQLCANADSAAAAASTTVATTKHSSTPTIGSSIMTVSPSTASATGLIVDTSSLPSASKPMSTGLSSTSASPSITTAVSTATLEPQGSDDTSSSAGNALAFDNSTPASVLSVASQTSSSSSSTKKTESAKETAGGGGSPFDTSDGSAPVTLSIVSLVPAVLACLLLQ